EHRTGGRPGRRATPAEALPVPPARRQPPAADRADDKRRLGALDTREPGVLQRFARGGERQAIGPRAPQRAAKPVGHFGGDPAPKAFGLDERDRTDRAGARAQAVPVRLDARAERAHHSETTDRDPSHRASVLAVMKCASVSNDRKCLVRSCDSSIRIPKRSSTAIESSMKSSESRPIEPSTPFGRVVSSVMSAARRGSNLSRDTRIVFSSSRTSLGSIALLVRLPREARAAPAPLAREPERGRAAARARQRQRDQRRAGQRLARPSARERLEG